MSPRLARMLGVAMVIAVGVGAYLWLRGPTRCDEAALQRAVSDLERLPYPQRPGAAAQALQRVCPESDSPMTRGWLQFVILQQDPDMMRRTLPGFDPDERGYHAMWAEVCPGGPSFTTVGNTRAHERTTLHDDCDFDRLGILDPAIGRSITPYSVRTWALVPWLQRMGVSPATTRELLRAMFLMHGWSDLPRLPPGLTLPRAPGLQPHPLPNPDPWTVHAGEVRGASRLVTSTTKLGWWVELLEALQDSKPRRITLFADASTSAGVLLRFAEMAVHADVSLRLMVEIDEPYLPYAALPVVLATEASSAAVQVNPEATLGELAPVIAAKLPCCGEMAPAQCPRGCVAVPLFAEGFPEPTDPTWVPYDGPDRGAPWPVPAWQPVGVPTDD